MIRKYCERCAEMLCFCFYLMFYHHTLSLHTLQRCTNSTELSMINGLLWFISNSGTGFTRLCLEVVKSPSGEQNLQADLLKSLHIICQQHAKCSQRSVSWRERGLVLHLGAHLRTWTEAFLCYPCL